MQRKYAEILAPAGDEDCLRAAVGAGADAVYFGLSSGFNARAKAANFAPENLADVFGWLHERGAKGYVTFNTVVYQSELATAERLLAAIARAGADAIIVQDLGVARLAHALAPDLPIHASTQMTVSSPEGAAVARSLGVKRVVLPRELSIEEIRRFRAGTDLELEVFVHGALCVSYSGQCLTSEAWGQRSANRGQCAQSCRLPYDLVLDGKIAELGLEKYLLSPKDLGAFNLLPELVDAGVSCFKIEGRYKGPDYVAAAVEKYRKVRDAYCLRGERVELSREDELELAFTHSRGFSPGWLAGDDHQELSHGLYPRHRGVRVGTVVSAGGYRVFVRPDPGAPPIKAGDWMVFDQGQPESEEPQGGIFAVEPPGRDGVIEVRFGDPGPDLDRLRPGDVLW
ncbi:MAG TPA: U32 family peptidase, partial [Planctomycetota bacterium]|nr:U32 family peptidase [Planctomycetota bacterium]